MSEKDMLNNVESFTALFYFMIERERERKKSLFLLEKTIVPFFLHEKVDKNHTKANLRQSNTFQ